MKSRFIFIFAVLFLTFPVFAFAQGHVSGGIVPNCGVMNGTTFKDCSFIDLITLGKNILNFIIAFAVTVSAIMFAYAGFLYFSSGANEKNISQARTIFTSVGIGLIVILTAWLVVNTLLHSLTGEGLNARTEKVQSQSSTNGNATGNIVIPRSTKVLSL